MKTNKADEVTSADRAAALRHVPYGAPKKAKLALVDSAEPIRSPVDAFAGTVAAGGTWSAQPTTVVKPGPRVMGRTAPELRPVPVVHTVLRATGTALGLGAVVGGVAMLALLSGPGAIVAALLLILAGILAALLCVTSQRNAEQAVFDVGKNVDKKAVSDFSGHVSFVPEYKVAPQNEQEIAAVLRAAQRDKKRVKVIGSGHSFSGAFATDGYLMSLAKLNAMQVIDKDKGLVSVGAGAKLDDIKEFLAANGLAFENLGGITKQAIAGAINTGTHGSGASYGIIATQVERLKLMTADGKTQWLSRSENPELFSAALVSMGALGVITEIVLRTRPAYNLKEVVTKTTFDEAFDQAKIEARLKQNDRFQIIWIPHSWDTFLVERNPTTAPADADFSHETPDAPFFERLAQNFGLALSHVSDDWRPALMAIAGGTQPAVDVQVGRSDLILSRPLPPRQRELEFAFPLADAEKVMRKLRAEIERQGLKMNFPCSMRFVKGDDLLMSPANRGDSFYISVLLQGESDQDDHVMQAIQRVFADLGGRPHWGKENDQVTAEELRDSYGESYDRFCEWLAKLDPQGTFRSDYVDRFFPYRDRAEKPR
ncbi:MAG: FAD-binding protein [Deltaproteobacteria bacterium]|nr:FAD-binding protein [Deltaproteobacteria bacterium]